MSEIQKANEKAAARPVLEMPPAPAVYSKILEVRNRTDLKLNPQAMGLTGKHINPAYTPRYYQIVGVMHLLMLKRMVLGDATGVGKTAQVIWTYSILKESEKLKLVVLAPKSALYQWRDEIEGTWLDGEKIKEGFASGIKAHVLSNKFKVPGKTLTSVEAREAQYKWVFSDAEDAPDVLIMHYGLLWRDDALLAKYARDFMLVLDEVTAVKNWRKNQTHVAARSLSTRAKRTVGLTATLLKNNLLEGWGIYNVVLPGDKIEINGLFGRITRFKNAFCVERLTFIPGLGRKVPQVVGYKNVKFFREAIDPYFLGRYKHEVSKELPELTTKDVRVEMSDAQKKKYEEALSGLIEMADGDFKETTALSELSYCQQIVNCPEILGFDIPSAKEEEFYRLLDEDFGFHFTGDEDAVTEADSQPEKIIVFTMYKTLIDRLQQKLEARGVKVCRITGDESGEERNEAKLRFSTSPDHNIIFINMAGSESINLQAASVVLFYDMPWSWGDYLQVLGRMIRIGSVHQKVLAIHLMAEGSIDGYKLKMLRRKKNLIDSVMGEAQQNALNFEGGSGDLFELLAELKRDANARR